MAKFGFRLVWRLSLACGLVAGCGSASLKPKSTGGTSGGTGGTTSGTGGTSGGVDARTEGGNGDAAQVCDVSRPFGTPVQLAGVNGAGGNDGTGRLSPDELTIFFWSDRSGNDDIFTATRASRTATFEAPRSVVGINTSGSEAWPSLTADGLTMFLQACVNCNVAQVLIATRTTLAAQFSTPSPVANVNTAGAFDGRPFVLPDESALYFASNRPSGSGGEDLYRAERGVGGQFGTPAQVSTINTPSVERAPALSPDELILYFGSNRTDSPAKGGFDIWMSKRISRTASFDPPLNVQELNTTGDEWPDWPSPDGCRLYLTRSGTTGSKIFVAERAM